MVHGLPLLLGRRLSAGACDIPPHLLALWGCIETEETRMVDSHGERVVSGHRLPAR